jgi:hypothetical protein
VMSRGISGSATGSCTGVRFSALAPTAPLRFPSRKSWKLPAAAVSVSSVSSFFFFFDGNPSRLFHEVSDPELLSAYLPLPSGRNRPAPKSTAPPRAPPLG